MRTVLCAVALLLAARPAWAVEPQYRQITLVDGRVMTVEIVATEAQGLLMRAPAGETLISFELLYDMIPVSKAEYDAQAPWVVYYDLPPELERDAVELMEAMSLRPQNVSSAENGVTAQMAAAAAGCERRVQCIADKVSTTDWKWVLSAEVPLDGVGTMLRAKVNKGTDTPLEHVLDGKSREALWEGLHAVLGLNPPTSGPPRGSTATEPDGGNGNGGGGPFDERKVIALSFVPVPGMPSLAQRDGRGFALALGVVVPSTVVWVGAVGQTGQSGPEFGLLSAAGYYAVTVLANQVAGFRSLERHQIGVSAMPTDHGGAQVVLTGR
ncbi:MAG: hypothetical protein ABMB14_05305 [Myxococcota bacterium]